MKSSSFNRRNFIKTAGFSEPHVVKLKSLRVKH